MKQTFQPMTSIVSKKYILSYLTFCFGLKMMFQMKIVALNQVNLFHDVQINNKFEHIFIINWSFDGFNG